MSLDVCGWSSSSIVVMVLVVVCGRGHGFPPFTPFDPSLSILPLCLLPPLPVIVAVDCGQVLVVVFGRGYGFSPFTLFESFPPSFPFLPSIVCGR